MPLYQPEGITDEGVDQGTASTLDFTGDGVSVTVVSGTAEVVVPGAADVSASYVVIAGTASLPNERVLGAGPGIVIGDQGIGGNVFISASLLAGPNITINQVGNAFAITGAAGGGGGGSIQWAEGSPSPRLQTTASLSQDRTASTFAEQKGTDNWLWVSGTITTGSANDKVAVFGGTVVISGNLNIGTTAGAISPTNNFIQLASTADVNAAESGSLRIYTRSRAGRNTLEQVGSRGIDTPLQPALFTNSTFFYSPGTGAALGTQLGWTFTSTGTISTPAIAVPGNQLGTIGRTQWTSAGVLGMGVGVFGAQTVCFRGNHVGQGGFFFFARFGVQTVLAQSRCFVGLAISASNLLTVKDITSSLNFVGVGWDRTNSSTGSWQIMSADGTTFASRSISDTRTRSNTTGSIMDLTLFCPPKQATTASFIGVRLIEYVSASTGVVKNILVDNLFLSTSIPQENFPLRVHAGMNTALSAGINTFNVNRLYLESDY